MPGLLLRIFSVFCAFMAFGAGSFALRVADSSSFYYEENRAKAKAGMRLTRLDIDRVLRR